MAVAAIAVVDMDADRRHTRQRLDDRAERVSVMEIAVRRLGMEQELPRPWVW